MSATDWQGVYAGIVKSLGEHYGYTPKEVSEMTSEQIEALTSKSAEDAKNNSTGSISIEEYRRMVRGG